MNVCFVFFDYQLSITIADITGYHEYELIFTSKMINNNHYVAYLLLEVPGDEKRWYKANSLESEYLVPVEVDKTRSHQSVLFVYAEKGVFV